MLRIAAKEEDSEHWGALKQPPQALTPTRTLAQARPSRDDGQGEVFSQVSADSCFLEQVSYIVVSQGPVPISGT